MDESRKTKFKEFLEVTRQRNLFEALIGEDLKASEILETANQWAKSSNDYLLANDVSKALEVLESLEIVEFKEGKWTIKDEEAKKLHGKLYG